MIVAASQTMDNGAVGILVHKYTCRTFFHKCFGVVIGTTTQWYQKLAKTLSVAKCLPYREISASL